MPRVLWDLGAWLFADAWGPTRWWMSAVPIRGGLIWYWVLPAVMGANHPCVRCGGYCDWGCGGRQGKVVHRQRRWAAPSGTSQAHSNRCKEPKCPSARSAHPRCLDIADSPWYIAPMKRTLPFGLQDSAEILEIVSWIGSMQRKTLVRIPSLVLGAFRGHCADS